VRNRYSGNAESTTRLARSGAAILLDSSDCSDRLQTHLSNVDLRRSAIVAHRPEAVLLRLYGPLELCFNQGWKPGDLELKN
jgi:hypothetical protein